MSQPVGNPLYDDRFGRIDPDMDRAVEIFSIELDRFKSQQIDEKVFTEFRLRHGVYGQRQDGVQMIRIKIPYGALTFEQMREIAAISEEYADGVSHVTTRQDIQLHFVKIDDTPMLMRRLASVGVTTKEACGNVVRNVTGCPKAGICQDQTFDVTPYAKGLADFLLGHPELQNFGRKFKISFSGCSESPCGLAVMHDIGAIAQVREVDGQARRGFKLLVGGGLGAVPHQAKVLTDFLPEEELLPTAQAICRVFTQHGERKRRMKARMKFLIEKLGIEEFRRMVAEEREKLEHDPRWTNYLTRLHETDEAPLKPPSSLNGAAHPDGFDQWARTNMIRQADEGYVTVQVTLPLGDLSADQFRGLADVASKYITDSVRLTVPQNILLRWVSEGDLIDLYNDLRDLNLAEPGAEGLADILACPGTDSCKLGISSSRGLAVELRNRLSDAKYSDVDDLSIKISGCPNSCGQHHIADIGFFGSAKRQGGHVAPHFQVVLGGDSGRNASAYGLAIGKVPAKLAPAFVERLLGVYRAERETDEAFPAFVSRVGKERIKAILAEFDALPDFDDSPELYVDWHRSGEYSLQTSTGECAGELVELVQFMLTEADRWMYEASLRYEKELYAETAQLTLKAMVTAADALLTTVGIQPSKPENTNRDFQERFVQPGMFSGPFAEFFDRWMTVDTTDLGDERAHFAIEEATLFVEQAHEVYAKMQVQMEQAAKDQKKARTTVTPKPAAEEPSDVEEIVDSLDLKGVECPYNYVQTKLRLEQMEVGQLLEITIDDGEPMRNVPASLKNDGQEILDTKKLGKHYRLLIRKTN